MAMDRVKRWYGYWKDEGMDMVVYKAQQKMQNKTIFGKDPYQRWMEGNERDITHVEELAYRPSFSVVIPVYNVAGNMLRECIDSVLRQTYRRFEIILVDDASTQEEVRSVLGEYEGRPRITVIYRKENGHISRATNDGIRAARGEFVALCDCDDLYAPNALYEIAKKLNESPTLDYIYSDEDKIDEAGKVRSSPFFKPDWSPQTFMSFMYTCHLSVFRRTLLLELSGFRVGFEGSQDYDMVLRVMEKTGRIGHVPKILYHWRMREESTANEMATKPYAMEAAARAKREALERRGEIGEVTLIPDVVQHRVTYFPQGNPLVSIIIPSKDNPGMLGTCLDGILKNTEYKHFEIIIVDNGSSEENRAEIRRMLPERQKFAPQEIKYLYRPMEFNFSAMCNLGADEAKGDFLLFLNDDIEVSKSVGQNPFYTTQVGQWLTILLGQAQVSYTGAVSCKLYYPGGIGIQHAGVLNLAIGPSHCLYGLSDAPNYYYGRNLLDYNFCAVTGACLMVGRGKFEEAGRFDENFPVAYNDVSLCFRLVELGYFNVVRNDVALIHHESVSRGLDSASAEREERRQREQKKLYKKHPRFSMGYDPCYNPNLVSNNIDFSFNMKNSYRHGKVEKLKPGDFAGYRRVAPGKKILEFHLDFVEEHDGIIQANGWIFNSKKRNNNHNRTRLLLKKDTGGVYAVTTAKSYRPDIRNIYEERDKAALSGFEAVFPKKGLPQGRYRIGLELDGLYVMCGHWIEI